MVPGGANQQGRLLKKTIVRDQAQGSGLDVRGTVHGVHQQPKRALVERDGHGVDGKIAATEVFLDGRGMVDRLARLGILGAVGADQIDANRSGKTEVEGTGSLVFAPDMPTKFFYCFL